MKNKNNNFEHELPSKKEKNNKKHFFHFVTYLFKNSNSLQNAKMKLLLIDDLFIVKRCH